MDTQQLARLIPACARQDARAQRELYGLCYPYGLTVALYYSTGREEAEELLHDALLKTFRHLDHLSAEQFRPWFRRVVINTAIDRFRQRRRERVVSLQAYQSGSCENLAVAKLNREDLHLLLARLPPVARLVFNLHALEGLSHGEIARRLHITKGASKSNLARARRHLGQVAALLTESSQSKTSHV